MFCCKCGTETPDDSQFCRKCGFALSAAPAVTLVDRPIASATPQTQSDLNTGTIVFSGFSLLSLLVCFAKGVVPIYFGEAVLWGVLAWYWHRKSPFGKNGTAIALLLGVGVAAGEGYAISRQSGPHYTYLNQGNAQVRVDTRSGRTDRLAGVSGWQPVSFDRPPDTLSLDSMGFSTVFLENGSWRAGLYTGGEICFDAQNNSDYVLQDVTIRVSVTPKSSTGTSSPDNPSAKLFTDVLTLKSAFGGLLDKGKQDRFCAPAQRVFPSGAEWTYTTESARGWK